MTASPARAEFLAKCMFLVGVDETSLDEKERETCVRSWPYEEDVNVIVCE